MRGWMRRFLHRHLQLLGAALCALTEASSVGCSSSSTEPVVSEGIVVSSTPNDVTVTNARARPIFVFAIGRNAAAVVDWRPCVSEPDCPSIPVGSSRKVVINSLLSSYHETEALVYWWHAVTRSGQLQPDSLRMIVVPLR